MRLIMTTLLAFLFFYTPAYAYIGPGMGAGAIATLLGILGALLLAIFSVLYYPVKRMLKNRKKKTDEESEEK
ncbi:MAG: hypothetical protein ACI8P9_004696 [Parasphingorhabdus sp.]|jgi:membrane protein implicated in regulation of membrane protease activity